MSTDTPRTLTQIVADLEPRLRQTLSSIRVEWQAGDATTNLSFALYTSGTHGPRLPEHTVSVDTADLPEGVSLTGIVRWPDLRTPLSTAQSVEQQLRDLDASGLVGTLDASRFNGGSDAARAGRPPITWVIKTHAGSDHERAEWLRSIHGR